MHSVQAVELELVNKLDFDDVLEECVRTELTGGKISFDTAPRLKHS